MFAGEKAEQNPWQVGTLEWTHSRRRPLHHNFDVIPTVLRGPHEYANPEVEEALGRDWIGQAEETQLRNRPRRAGSDRFRHLNEHGASTPEGCSREFGSLGAFVFWSPCLPNSLCKPIWVALLEDSAKVRAET